jgi:hypothetical protein
VDRLAGELEESGAQAHRQVVGDELVQVRAGERAQRVLERVLALRVAQGRRVGSEQLLGEPLPVDAELEEERLLAQQFDERPDPLAGVVDVDRAVVLEDPREGVEAGVGRRLGVRVAVRRRGFVGAVAALELAAAAAGTRVVRFGHFVHLRRPTS